MLAAEPPYAAQVIAGHAMQLAAVGDGCATTCCVGSRRRRRGPRRGGRPRPLHAHAVLRVGPRRGSQLHYDQYANLFVRVAGHKRFALVAPDGARALRPFPVHHPPTRARADLDLRAGASRARGRARAGRDALHPVALVAPRADPRRRLRLVNTVLDRAPAARAAATLSAPLQLELARRPSIVADTLGPSAVGPFFWHVERELAEADEPRGAADEPEPPPWLELQNYFILQLGRVIGPGHVPGLCGATCRTRGSRGWAPVRSCLSDFK